MKLVFLPLGASYIASVIRNDVDVKIMDASAEGFHHEDTLDENFITYGSPLSDIRKRIEDFKPDLVGVTCLFSAMFPVVRNICKMVKEIDPDIITMTGGTYPTFLAESCLEEESLDMIGLGESEHIVRDVIRNINEGKPVSELDGLAYKEKGEIKINPKTKYIDDLDELPFPARDLLPMDLYAKINVPHSFSAKEKMNAPLITSRGCPAKCIYCSSSVFWGNRYRMRSPDNVLDEIGELIDKWGIKEIQFEDDNITANRERARKIFQGIIDRGYKISFNFPNGMALWTLDEEMIDLIKAAGCYEMTLAYESGCQEVLRNIVKKPLNLEKAAEITQMIKKKGIRTNAFYIFGFPGETREQIQETFNFANRMKTDTAYFFVANPLPGTELYRISRDQGLLRDDFSFENLTFTRSAYKPEVWPEGELERMAVKEFLNYNLRSLARNPLPLLKKAFVDLFFQRPRYSLGLFLRVIRRNFVKKRNG